MPTVILSCMHHQLELSDALTYSRCLTCLLCTEMLQRVSSRVGIKQQDSEIKISVAGNQYVFLRRERES